MEEYVSKSPIWPRPDYRVYRHFQTEGCAGILDDSGDKKQQEAVASCHIYTRLRMR